MEVSLNCRSETGLNRISSLLGAAVWLVRVLVVENEKVLLDWKARVEVQRLEFQFLLPHRTAVIFLQFYLLIGSYAVHVYLLSLLFLETL